MAKARRAVFEVPPTRRNRLWQTDFSEFETTAGGDWQLGGVVDYVAKVNLACPLTPTQTARDAVAKIEAAMAEAERLVGTTLLEDCVDVETGEIEPLVIVSDNGPAYRSDGFARFLLSHNGLFVHVRTRYRSPQTNGSSSGSSGRSSTSTSTAWRSPTPSCSPMRSKRIGRSTTRSVPTRPSGSSPPCRPTWPTRPSPARNCREWTLGHTYFGEICPGKLTRDSCWPMSPTGSTPAGSPSVTAQRPAWGSGEGGSSPLALAVDADTGRSGTRPGPALAAVERSRSVPSGGRRNGQGCGCPRPRQSSSPAAGATPERPIRRTCEPSVPPCTRSAEPVRFVRFPVRRHHRGCQRWRSTISSQRQRCRPCRAAGGRSR